MSKAPAQMKENQDPLPFYARASIFIVGAFALLTVVYIARSILVPLAFSLVFAIVLHPVVAFFHRRKLPRAIAVLLTMILAFLAIAACGVLLYSQARELAQSWPLLVDRFAAMLDQTITWISDVFHINPQSIHDWIAKSETELVNTNTASIGQALATAGNAIVVLLLIPVYVFLISYYQPLLLEFIRRLFSASNHSQVNEIISQTKSVIQRYLAGLVIEAVIVASLNTVALFALGIDYAILLGVVGALLNLIPIIGGIVAVILPILLALATKSSAWYAVYVLAAYYLIQLFDNNFLIPKVVASKVRINALFSIIVVIVGNAFWGIPGMFLAIPLLAIGKVILDRIEPLKPWGFLFGDTMPALLRIEPILRKLRRKKSPAG